MQSKYHGKWHNKIKKVRITMGFSDVLKKSFLENAQVMELNLSSIILVLLVTVLLGCYIFAVYRIVAKNNFYQTEFAVSLAVLAVITAAIIMTIQSSVVISLGMVGALSIVRFRTAIKNPLDLVFLFWSISVGIICGAGLFTVGVVVSLVITVLIFALRLLPVGKRPKLLVINSSDTDSEDAIVEILENEASMYKIKTRNLSANHMDYIIEVRTANEKDMMKQLQSLKGMETVSLLSHDGEVSY